MAPPICTGPGLALMRASTSPGLCPMCGDEIPSNPRGRKLKHCGDDVCRRAYFRYYMRDRRQRERERNRATSGAAGVRQPWVLRTRERWSPIVMVGDRYVWLAGSVPSRERPGEHEANARLIAAAPDLLAALKALLDDDSEIHDAVNAARAAISKAEGES